MAIGWARKHHAAWGAKGRNVADSMRQQFPWHDDDELARILLWLGDSIEFTHRHGSGDWPALDIAAWARIMQAAAVELAHLDLENEAT